MFPRHKRLSRAQFPTALTRGRRVSSVHFTAVLPDVRTDSSGAYAVVISKKIARLSVTRHRIKRQILGALRTFPTLPPSLIIFPKPSALRLDALHLREELAHLVGSLSTRERFGEK